MIFTINGCEIDAGAYEVRRGGTVVPVEPQVFDLLVLLLENRNRLVTKDEILEHVWKGRAVSEAALSSRVKAARKAIGDDGAAQICIRTVHRRGFRIVADVTVSDGEALAAAAEAPVSQSRPTDEEPRPPGALEPPEDRTSLVVLPFRFIGDAGGHEYMLEGLHDELTSALARVRSFFVIARGTATALAARDMDVREIAETLGVRYVVEGSLRVSGETLRVNAKLTDAIETARRATALDDSDPLVLTMLATAECLARETGPASTHIKRALSIDPNFAWGWIRCGLINAYIGKTEAAFADFEKATRLSPLDPLHYLIHFGMSYSYFTLGQYEDAVAFAEKCLVEKPKGIWVNRLLAASAAMAGDEAKAARCVATVERYAPNVRVSDIMEAVPPADEGLRAQYRDALLRAGFRP